MVRDNQDLLFASLLGTNVAKNATAYRLVEDEAMKKVGFAIPFLPFGREPNVPEARMDTMADLWKADPPLNQDEQFFPMTFEIDGKRFLLPYEPFISISGKNTIIKRNVAKQQTEKGRVLGGSIKERWNQGDYDITIIGVLYGALITGSAADCFPRADFEKLRDYMTAAKRVTVYCEPLQLLGINHIVIEDFSFPFSKGGNVQAYEIKAVSDFDYKLLLDIND